MARPRIEDSRRRDRQFGLRLNSAEAVLIERAAGRSMMTRTTYIREAAVAAARESEDQPAAAAGRESEAEAGIRAELRAMASNLNQLLKLAHSGKDPNLLGPVLKLHALVARSQT